MNKIIFIFSFCLLTLNSFSQCWESLDVDGGDTNSLHYVIKNDGTLWKLSTPGYYPSQLGFQKSWKHCFTSSSQTTFVIADDSTLWGFGENSNGQLGIGNTNYQDTLIQLNNSKWISLSSSWGHTTAIKADGTMWFWGQGWQNPTILLPTQIGTENDWKDLHTDYSNTIAIKNSGTLWMGNVGSNLTQIGSDADWKYVWLNQGSSNDSSWVGIKNNGTMWQNGIQVGTDSDWKMVKGQYNTVALKNNGSAWYWNSQIDINTPPISLNQSISFKDISIGNDYDYIYAISTSGEIYNSIIPWWGANPYLSKDIISNETCVSVSFEVYNDPTQQCSWGTGIEGVTITIQPGNYVTTTNQNGYATFANLPDGNYTAIVDTTNSNWASNCPTTISFSVVNGFDQIDSNYFFLYNTNPCSDPDVSIYAPFLRRCLPNQKIYVNACNQTTATGILSASYVDVELDPLMTVTGSSLPYTNQGNNIYRFQTGTLNPSQCVSFNITTTISCNAMLGQTLCMDANLYPVQSCALDTVPSDPITNNGTVGTLNGFPQPCTLPWDQSSLSVDGWCANDSIYFTITNTGSLGAGDMECYSPMWITVDGVVTYTDSIMISGGQTITLAYPGDGATWILNAEQHPLHPGNSHPNAHVEACGGTTNWTSDIVNDFPQDDADPVVDIYCGVVTGSYDPNDKTGYPTGQTDQKYIQPNQQLQYVIRFQNTGTDTAFTVVIRDTLDFDLNIFTVTAGVSSHQYVFRMYGPRVLEWTFNNINLPDSTTDQEGSNGFVTFHVEQVPNLAPGTEITNDADIYFDFNDPITTNTTMHRIYEGFVSVLNIEDLTQEGKSISVYPNPTSNNITIKGETNMSQPFSIFDQMGREVFKGKLTGTETEVNLSSLSKGIYTLKIEGNYQPAQIVKE
jgi:uncharacterized repeat protein (TIGR01451 family)